MKIRNSRTGSSAYEIYMLKDEVIYKFLKDSDISNMTRLDLDGIVAEIENECWTISFVDNPLCYDKFSIDDYLHRNGILETNIHDVYVSPLAYYYILSTLYDKHSWDNKLHEIDDTDDDQSGYDALFGYDEW